MWKDKVKENAKSSLSVLYQGVKGKSVKRRGGGGGSGIFRSSVWGLSFLGQEQRQGLHPLLLVSSFFLLDSFGRGWYLGLLAY